MAVRYLTTILLLFIYEPQAGLGVGMALYFGFILYLLANGLSSRLQGDQRLGDQLLGDGGAYQLLPDTSPQEEQQQQQQQRLQQHVEGKQGQDKGNKDRADEGEGGE
jgi:hypothetical protein